MQVCKYCSNLYFCDFRKHDCQIIHDMLTISKLLEEKLVETNDLMKNLHPRLVLVGSTQEGARIGIGNEADLTVHFLGWEKCSPFKICDDAFHLYKSEMCPMWMDIYFNSKYQFELVSFLHNFCEAISSCCDIIFKEHLNPSNLVRIQSNTEYIVYKSK